VTVKGHTSLLVMVPFDTPHTISS